MSIKYKDVKLSTLAFAAKFGFVTKELFFEYLCPLSQNRKFVHWRRLLIEGYLQPSPTLPDVRYLTPAGRKAIGRAVPARAIYFIEHDSIAAKLYLELNSSGLLIHSSTEYELKTSPWNACNILGGDNLDKVPDLTADLKSNTGFIRIAIEVERSRKTNFRYDQLALRYLRLRQVHLMLFCCNKLSTANAIERAFNAETFRNSGKIPALFLITEFEKNRMAVETKFLKKRMPLKTLLLAALEQPTSAWSEKVKTGDNPFFVKSNDKKGAA